CNYNYNYNYNWNRFLQPPVRQSIL
ncbi:MAG: hypothetical protein QOF46_489, partial [Paraburkholderia sp.]|nr:hypothetical protein [Paraburkholderia sp.]